MGARAYTSKYIDSDIIGRASERLVPLLYEHLIAQLRRLQVQIQQRDFEGKAESLEKASVTVAELQATIDRAFVGESPSPLDALYAYLDTEILAIGRTMDSGRLAKLIGMIASLHESWVIASRTRWPQGAVAEGLFGER